MSLNGAYEKFGSEIEFFNIYIREAHPADGWAMFRNMDEGIVHNDPTTTDERAEVARACFAHLTMKLPSLLDAIDDKVNIAYNAHPVRIFVIDKDGRVAWRGGIGPRDLMVDEAMAAIEEQAALIG